MKKKNFDFNFTEYEISFEDDDKIRTLKEIIYRVLTQPELKIFLTYTDLGTYTDVAKKYKCSIPTVRKYVGICREKIMCEIKKNL